MKATRSRTFRYPLLQLQRNRRIRELVFVGVRNGCIDRADNDSTKDAATSGPGAALLCRQVERIYGRGGVSFVRVNAPNE